MPIELSLDEIAERLGEKDNPVFGPTIASMLFNANISSRMVPKDNGFVRKFLFTLDSEVPLREIYVQTEKGEWK